MVHSIWPESNGGNKPLPAPNVVVARAGTPPEQLSLVAERGPSRTRPRAGRGLSPWAAFSARRWLWKCKKQLPSMSSEG